MSVIFFPIEMIGYLETTIRILLLIFLLNANVLKIPVVFLILVNLLFAFFVPSDVKFTSYIFVAFDFCLPFLFISKYYKDPGFFSISVTHLRNLSILTIGIIGISQFLSLDDIYYPYSETLTMGPFRNKAIYSMNFLLFFYLNKVITRKKAFVHYTLIVLLAFILVFSFRRTAWVLLAISLISFIDFRKKANMIILAFMTLIVLIPVINYFSSTFTTLLEDRSSEYLFNIDEGEWRVQEFLYHINDVQEKPGKALIGNYLNDPMGKEFWGRYGVENSIHVDIIRLVYYFGYIAFFFYVITIAKFFRRAKISRKLKVQLVLIYIIAFTSGGILVQIFNITVFFILTSNLINEKNTNHNIITQERNRRGRVLNRNGKSFRESKI